MVTVTRTDLLTAQHQADFLMLLNAYATDIMGGGEPLPESTQNSLIQELQKVDAKAIFIAYDGDTPLGIANTFFGFSTFKAKPLLNVHDFAVVPEARGRGVAKLMLEEIEQFAQEKGCCKLTLEVLEGNSRAIKVYHDFGFEGYELDPEAGKAMFFEKSW